MLQQSRSVVLDTPPPTRGTVMRVVTRKQLAGITLAATGAVIGSPAFAVEQTVDFGSPTVLSQQGQRLKVVLPVRSATDDRATAASFMVRETEVPQGYQPLPAQNFTVMRPATADYVVFHSGEVVDAPEVSLIVSVAGDPRSPYRMDLQVPANANSRTTLTTLDTLPARARHNTLATRKLRAPEGEASLPPK
jgi:hypothetical protein